MAAVDILLPTSNRLPALLMTLAGVANQTVPALRVVVADQSAPPVSDAPEVQTLRRVIEARGGTVEWHSRTPSRGSAEQCQFLLEQARAEAVLYLDDNVFMEPEVVARLLQTLRADGCGFVGAPPLGSFPDDEHPARPAPEYWNGRVEPEVVEPGTPQWARRQPYRATFQHAGGRRPPGEVQRIKVAWLDGCVLYDRAKLLEVGGFAFWARLPRAHTGAAVLVQNLLLRRWGGCALVPSGTTYCRPPATRRNDLGAVDGPALDLLSELVARYAAQPLYQSVAVPSWAW